MQMSDVNILRSRFETMKREAEIGLAMLDHVMAGKTVPKFVDIVKARLQPLEGEPELIRTDLNWPVKKCLAGPFPKERQNYVLLVDGEQMNCITTDTKFAPFYDPVCQYDVVKAGYIGRMLGIPILTDAYLPPEERFIDFGAGFLYCPEVNSETHKYFNIEPVKAAQS